jgi:hypothetical protein
MTHVTQREMKRERSGFLGRPGAETPADVLGGCVLQQAVDIRRAR